MVFQENIFLPHIEITIVDVKGSAPREAGAFMVWYPDGRAVGTIGGGNLEQQTLAEAAKLWGDPERRTAFLEYPLSARLGQCCGGLARVFLNKRLPSREVLICGGGHVGAALAAVLANTPLKISVVDSREEWGERGRFPSNVEVLHDDPQALLAEWGERAQHTYLLIMTHDHPTDLALCQLALRYPFLWIGLIGSKTKWLRFRGRMKARGFSDEELGRITSPIGFPSLGRTPQEIAVGVGAQLLALYHQGSIEKIVPSSEVQHAPGRRAALILAGGASRRMGRWKGGLDWHGRPLLTAHATMMTEAGAEIWKAIYPETARAEAEKVVPPGHRIINADPDAPMFASIQLGLRELLRENTNLDSIALTPVDSIPLSSDLTSALWDRHESSGAWVTQPRHQLAADSDEMQHGHPIILDQRLFAPILAADPANARLDFLVRDLAAELKTSFDLPADLAPANLNTPEDYLKAIG